MTDNTLINSYKATGHRSARPHFSVQSDSTDYKSFESTKKKWWNDLKYKKKAKSFHRHHRNVRDNNPDEIHWFEQSSNEDMCQDRTEQALVVCNRIGVSTLRLCFLHYHMHSHFFILQ